MAVSSECCWISSAQICLDFPLSGARDELPLELSQRCGVRASQGGYIPEWSISAWAGSSPSPVPHPRSCQTCCPCCPQPQADPLPRSLFNLPGARVGEFSERDPRAARACEALRRSAPPYARSYVDGSLLYTYPFVSCAAADPEARK